MKRIIWLIVTLSMALAIPASANYLLLAPTGTTLSTGQVRAEAALSSDGNHGEYYWLATGLMQVEVSLLQRNPQPGQKQSILGAQWNFLPETSFTPAIGFGVTDVTSESEDGVAGYVAITKHLPVVNYSGLITDLSVTAGLGLGGIKGPFGGVEAHLPGGMFVQAEYDSHDINAAIGWQPVSMFRVKAYSLKGDTFLGAELLPIRF